MRRQLAPDGSAAGRQSGLAILVAQLVALIKNTASIFYQPPNPLTAVYTSPALPPRILSIADRGCIVQSTELIAHRRREPHARFSVIFV